MSETAADIIAGWFENLHPEEPNARKLSVVANEIRALTAERDKLKEAITKIVDATNFWENSPTNSPEEDAELLGVMREIDAAAALIKELEGE